MSQDISVAYFGLDWNHAYMTLDGLALKVDHLFLQKKSSSLVPRHAQYLTKALLRLNTDLDAHCEAVIKGRTSRKQKEYIRFKKKFFNAY